MTVGDFLVILGLLAVLAVICCQAHRDIQWEQAHLDKDKLSIQSKDRMKPEGTQNALLANVSGVSLLVAYVLGTLACVVALLCAF